MRTIRFPDGAEVPALGQGTWMMAERADRRAGEITALRTGVDLGMTLIDTAEMYADGGSERLVGEAVAGIRDRVFLVSKAYPQNATRDRLPRTCEASLRRLGTDRLDLYLLHWRGGVPLAETVEAMERLVEQGNRLRLPDGLRAENLRPSTRGCRLIRAAEPVVDCRAATASTSVALSRSDYWKR